MSKFQIIILVVFGFAALVAVLIFAGLIPGARQSEQRQYAGVRLSIWGTVPGQALAGVLANVENQTGIKLKYFQKPKDIYEADLIDALAAGKGPDIWLISQDLVLKHQNKIFPLSFQYFGERLFKDSFVEGAEVFLTSEAIMAMPFSLDPLVLYWNRDLFSNAGIAQPPKNWDEFLQDVQKLTLVDSAGNILQSGASLGEFSNVLHSKEIISLLILQAGNPILDPKTLNITLTQSETEGLKPAENALSFFTDFSNPAKISYSWNRTLAKSDQMFLEGKLAMYFGFASEYQELKKKNPHLNFDVAKIPQIKDSPRKAVFSRINSLVVSRSSSNIDASWSAVFNLISPENIQQVSRALFLAPSRRDALAELPQDPALLIFYQSGLQAKTWLEPDSQKTTEIFREMIESVISGRKRLSEAVSEGAEKLQALLQK